MWIEYKYIDRIPQSKEIKLALTKLQLEWLQARYYENRRVFVILGTPHGGIILQDMEWTKTFTDTELADRLQSRKEIAFWISVQCCGHYEAPRPRGKRLRRVV
jgi:hypothetical protein